MAEINLVTKRPKLQKYFSPVKVAELMDFLQVIGLVIDVKSTVNVCRDLKDNYLLALAKDSNAHYLITGDLDLLIIKEFERTKIVTYQDFYCLFYK